MLNNEYNNNQNVEIKPACMGLLQKSHPKSYFKWCHVGSDYRKNVIDCNPLVLQVMVFGDNNMMVEMLPQDVYEEWIGKEKVDWRMKADELMVGDIVYSYH